MRTRVKICGITRVDDGLAAANAGADAIGMQFWPGTPRRVAIENARAIATRLPPFVMRVGLFVNPTSAEVQSVLDEVPLDVLQFHGHEPADLCRAFERPYLKAFAVESASDLLESLSAYGDAAAWLFDSPPRDGRPGGTGHTFDWSRLPAKLARPLVLAGGLNKANVADAIRRLRPWAVDVSSGVEALDADGRAKPGIKDAQRIAAFIEEVRHADV
ncbi:MAG TPA: phosphoribosylanthranilate isomerase [Casimicrobiaceae bacterium]|nr:phosphoribosylanthranilate isomerase [Casimicrobiaceae bacterium]